MDGIADTKEKQKRYLLAIQTRARDLENLVNQLSAYNQMENHTFHYHMQVEDLGKFAGEYLEENQDFVREHRLDVALEAEGQNQIWMDEGAFKRILDNLLTNTIRYREKEESHVQIAVLGGGGRVRWRVWDDGPGVDEGDLERIFESFCRLDASRTHCEEGSGLGLAIVKRIVADHRGSVCAKNHGGLEICMEFPAAQRGAANGENTDYRR